MGWKVLKVSRQSSPKGCSVWNGSGSSIYYLAAPLVLIELKANPIDSVSLELSARRSTWGWPISWSASDRVGRRPSLLLHHSSFPCPVFSYDSSKCGTHFDSLNLEWFVYVHLLALFPGLDRRSFDQGSLARDLGSFNSSWTSATLFGPVFSGFMYALHPRLPFVLGAALALTVFLIVWRSLQMKKFSASMKRDPSLQRCPMCG